MMKSLKRRAIILEDGVSVDIPATLAHASRGVAGLWRMKTTRAHEHKKFVACAWHQLVLVNDRIVMSQFFALSDVKRGPQQGT